MSRDASASEKNLTVKDTSVKTIVSPCGGVKCEYGEASALQSTEVLHPIPLHSAAHEGCGPREKSSSINENRLFTAEVAAYFQVKLSVLDFLCFP